MAAASTKKTKADWAKGDRKTYVIQHGSFRNGDDPTVAYGPGDEVELLPHTAAALGDQVKLADEGRSRAAKSADDDPKSPINQPQNVELPKLSESSSVSTGNLGPASVPGGQTAPDGTPTGEAKAQARIHDATVEDVKAKLAKAKTAEEVHAIRDAEAANPKHSGGRSGVMEAAERRLDQLKDE